MGFRGYKGIEIATGCVRVCRIGDRKEFIHTGGITFSELPNCMAEGHSIPKVCIFH